MTYTTLEEVRQPLEQFAQFDADTQLALLWYGYLDLKENLTPAPGHKVEGVALPIYDKIKPLSEEDQLQAQRDIANGTDTEVSREYGALSPSGKLDVWLLLAQGMESGDIVNVPDNYELPENTKEFTETIKSFDFEQRVNFTRNAVSAMGHSAAKS
ncbi:orange carotenoid protein N-terminal domain-containing protein [Oscillatoria sp. CS-180]|uniref:orange carotenoid protein N-terminal domain-containing protein n=1 Tax=Oscillatoria sp. CS-180 TaxID=3021720 RepID=UPI00232CA7CA|nr:orange carotenoid protein N-terminal domain-containing protein [Oscillatoria sp. CS-180]MDB9526342.1 orange carotenoid protein N-terminal domain-containing protein [Oscillatoria sp. CS-180]